MKVFPIVCLALAAAIGVLDARDKEVTVAEDRLSVALPPGWKESEQETGRTDSVAGFESSDRKTSFYIIELKLQNQADDVFAALERTIDAFDADENWIVKNFGKIRDVDINGCPSAYLRVELDLISGEREVPFVFHFTMVGAKESFFLLQASTHKPVRGVREQELFRMMKSFKVLKE